MDEGGDRGVGALRLSLNSLPSCADHKSPLTVFCIPPFDLDLSGFRNTPEISKPQDLLPFPFPNLHLNLHREFSLYTRQHQYLVFISKSPYLPYYLHACRYGGFSWDERVVWFFFLI